MLHVSIHYWAVLVAAVINMAVGAAWYSPAMFGKEWAKLLGKKVGDMGNRNAGYSVSMVAALVQSFLLAFFVAYAGATTAAQGALVGLMAWAGFAATVTAGDTVFSGRPWRLWAINTGYYLFVLIVNGALLAVWR